MQPKKNEENGKIVHGMNEHMYEVAYISYLYQHNQTIAPSEASFHCT